jgi:hypothetical protein
MYQYRIINRIISYKNNFRIGVSTKHISLCKNKKKILNEYPYNIEIDESDDIELTKNILQTITKRDN